MKAQQDIAEQWAFFLDKICHVPNPLASHEDAQRYCHADLSAMPECQLEREFERTRFRWIFDDCPPAWVMARLSAVERMLDARRTTKRHDHRAA